MFKIIDLSVPTEPSPSEMLPVDVIRESHERSVPVMKAVFGCTEDDLPQRLGWTAETVKLNSHVGTHVDAPWHYFPTSACKRARTIDELPVEWFYGDGVVLDMRHKEKGAAISVVDLEDSLRRISHKLRPGDIVLIQTGADKLWGSADYPNAGCGMVRDSTLWLIEQGIKVMGTDAWGWDRPFWAIKAEFEAIKDKSILWAGHRAGIEREYCHIEKLANLDKLPKPFNFKVACFPIKLTGGSAGWCRAVAIVEE